MTPELHLPKGKREKGKCEIGAVTARSQGAVTEHHVHLSTKQQKRDKKRAEKRLHVGSESAYDLNRKKSKQDSVGIERLSVYKRECVLPKPVPKGINVPNKRMMLPADQGYDLVMKECYDGFIAQPPNAFENNFHSDFYEVLSEMEKKDYFQFDLTQPAGLGTKVAKTFVTRCLVGDPGTTYKYLGVRMFAHSWLAGDVGVCNGVSKIKSLNERLIAKTEKLLKESGKVHYGSCQYNLTLINRCFAQNDSIVKLKDEPLFKREKCTVSWHADSTLEHFSSIAVYNCLKRETLTTKSDDCAGEEGSWRIALRVLPHAEGPSAGKLKTPLEANTETNTAPPIAFPLPDRWSYFLLDDFNHHHQHAVLVGDADRFASTHRVCRTEGHTFDSIKRKCQSAIEISRVLMGTPKNIKAIQTALTEVEFEWIRQFYVQGQIHSDLHVWWHKPLEELLSFWGKLEELTRKVIVQALRDAALSEEDGLERTLRASSTLPGEEQRKQKKKLKKRILTAKSVSAESFDDLIDSLADRQIKRAGWRAREMDPSYKMVERMCRPMKIPWPESSAPDEENEIRNLDSLISEMKKQKISFLHKKGNPV